MTNIALIGSGRVATNLATGLATSGHLITVGTRDAANARAHWAGPDVAFSDIVTAIRQADIVINATPGDTSLALFAGLREALVGRILVDLSNATRRRADGLPGGLLFAEGSLAERLQQALPETFVVKTLNTMLFTVMTQPASLNTPPVVFLSGDQADAKSKVRTLLHDLGWRDEWIEDLGGIASAQGTEAMVLLVPYLLKARGFAPFAFSVAR